MNITKSLGLIIGIISIMLVLFGILHLVSRKKDFYLPEGFTTESIEYPVNPLTEIKNPITKLMKKLGNMSVFFANPKVWIDVYKTSQMSISDLARRNIKKEKEEQEQEQEEEEKE